MIFKNGSNLYTYSLVIGFFLKIHAILFLLYQILLGFYVRSISILKETILYSYNVQVCFFSTYLIDKYKEKPRKEFIILLILQRLQSQYVIVFII